MQEQLPLKEQKQLQLQLPLLEQMQEQLQEQLQEQKHLQLQLQLQFSCWQAVAAGGARLEAVGGAGWRK